MCTGKAPTRFHLLTPDLSGVCQVLQNLAYWLPVWLKLVPGKLRLLQAGQELLRASLQRHSTVVHFQAWLQLLHLFPIGFFRLGIFECKLKMSVFRQSEQN